MLHIAYARSLVSKRHSVDLTTLVPCKSSTLEFEKLNSGIVRATLRTQHNNPRVNSHNRVMLQHWRAIVNLQIIVDVDACAMYMAKYAAKANRNPNLYKPSSRPELTPLVLGVIPAKPSEVQCYALLVKGISVVRKPPTCFSAFPWLAVHTTSLHSPSMKVDSSRKTLRGAGFTPINHQSIYCS